MQAHERQCDDKTQLSGIRYIIAVLWIATCLVAYARMVWREKFSKVSAPARASAAQEIAGR